MQCSRHGNIAGLTDTPIHEKTGLDGKSEWMEAVLANNESCQPEDIAECVADMIADDRLAGGDWAAVRRLDGKVERQWGHADTL